MRSKYTQGMQGASAGLNDFVNVARNTEITTKGDSKDVHRLDSDDIINWWW